MSKVGRRSPKGEYTPRDHYMEVTDQIIAALEAGTPPWRKPWDPGKAGNPGMPCNAVTGTRYRGINVVTLATSPLALAGADLACWTANRSLFRSPSGYDPSGTPE